MHPLVSYDHLPEGGGGDWAVGLAVMPALPPAFPVVLNLHAVEDHAVDDERGAALSRADELGWKKVTELSTKRDMRLQISGAALNNLNVLKIDKKRTKEGISTVI